MKTWKKIEDAKKRTNEIAMSKKRNEEKVQKVTICFNNTLILENCGPLAQHRRTKIKSLDQLRDLEAETRGEA